MFTEMNDLDLPSEVWQLRQVCQSRGWQHPQIQGRLSSAACLYLVTTSWEKQENYEFQTAYIVYTCIIK